MIRESLSQLPLRFVDDIAVWWMDLDSLSHGLSSSWLGSDEIERGERLRDPRDARRFLVSRIALRRVLGTVLGRAPETLSFRTNEYGKPCLVDEPIHFSLSRSGSNVIIGVSGRCMLGVDVETLRSLPDADALANLHLTGAERDIWLGAGPAQRRELFFQFWTRKEAIAKALGIGLRLAPNLIDAGFSGERGTARVAMGGAIVEMPVWSLMPRVGVVAAIAKAPDSEGWRTLLSTVKR